MKSYKVETNSNISYNPQKNGPLSFLELKSASSLENSLSSTELINLENNLKNLFLSQLTGRRKVNHTTLLILFNFSRKGTLETENFAHLFLSRIKSLTTIALMLDLQMERIKDLNGATSIFTLEKAKLGISVNLL